MDMIHEMILQHPKWTPDVSFLSSVFNYVLSMIETVLFYVGGESGFEGSDFPLSNLRNLRLKVQLYSKTPKSTVCLAKTKEVR
jgi:hypothetical protein